jgi:hypothetical protein
MPNYDAGHYFLTVLSPIRMDSILIQGQSRSRRHLLRDALAFMPNGERTTASAGKGEDNPFARNTRTHFARFVVLDDVVFNGRDSGDALLNLATNQLAPQPLDQLSTPFLICAVDLDAESAADSELRTYLTELWTTMPKELSAVFRHCTGFNEVATAADFFNYIKKCQIETTMPFNDYWSAPLNLPDFNLVPYGIAAIALLALSVAFALSTHLPWLWLGAFLGPVLVAVSAYLKIVRTARAPFPKSPAPAPAPDLPTVLKALYLQRAFTDLAIRAQGMTDKALYEEFGNFIANHKPGELAAPTQRPGVIVAELQGMSS